MLRNRVEPASEFQGKAYQNQLVKFNRILAHLVNERTVLAWFRANLALVALNFKYLKLAAAFEDRMYASTMLAVCGGVFVTLLPISWWSGYRRYARCKQLLDSDVAQISVYLHKMGFDLDSSVFSLLVLSAFLTLCTAPPSSSGSQRALSPTMTWYRASILCLGSLNKQQYISRLTTRHLFSIYCNSSNNNSTPTFISRSCPRQ